MARPKFLTRDDVVVPVPSCSCPQGCQVASGLRLGETLPPPLLSAQEGGRIPLCKVRREAGDRRTQGFQEQLRFGYRQTGQTELVVEHSAVTFIATITPHALRPPEEVRAPSRRQRRHESGVPRDPCLRGQVLATAELVEFLRGFKIISQGVSVRCQIVHVNAG